MRWLAFLLLVLAPAAAHGHDVFWHETPDGWVLMEGHRPGEEHDGETATRVDPALVVAVHVGGCTEDIVNWRASATDTLAAGTQALFAVVDWGWWTKTAFGTKRNHPDQVPGYLAATRSRETTKHVAAACGGDAVVGAGLELTPVDGLVDLTKGDKLTVRVTFDGEPVPDVVVVYHGKPRGTTGRDGTIRIKLREPGLQVIRASWRRPLADVAGAEDLDSATLTFALEEAP